MLKIRLQQKFSHLSNYNPTCSGTLLQEKVIILSQNMSPVSRVSIPNNYEASKNFETIPSKSFDLVAQILYCISKEIFAS